MTPKKHLLSVSGLNWFSSHLTQEFPVRHLYGQLAQGFDWLLFVLVAIWELWAWVAVDWKIGEIVFQVALDSDSSGLAISS